MQHAYWPFKKYQKVLWLCPSILGIVQREQVRCGRSNCACVRGKVHHAYYHYYRDPLTKQHIKHYIPRLAVSKLKQRIQYWKNKYYFWNFLPSKTIAYSGEFLDKTRMSLFYKRLHILTQHAKTNFLAGVGRTDNFSQTLYANEWSGKPYRYLLHEKGAHVPTYLELLLKRADMRL